MVVAATIVIFTFSANMRNCMATTICWRVHHIVSLKQAGQIASLNRRNMNDEKSSQRFGRFLKEIRKKFLLKTWICKHMKNASWRPRTRRHRLISRAEKLKLPNLVRDAAPRRFGYLIWRFSKKLWIFRLILVFDIKMHGFWQGHWFHPFYDVLLRNCEPLMMICLKILIFFTLRRGVIKNIFRDAPRGLATLIASTPPKVNDLTTPVQNQTHGLFWAQRVL